VDDAVRHVTTDEQREWLYAARQRGGRCAGCGRTLAVDDVVYVEPFLIEGAARVPGAVGPECASPAALRDTQGREPERCDGCGRPMHYLVTSRRRQRAICSRRCDNNVGNRRRKAGA
jgi:hypothetical protein